MTPPISKLGATGVPGSRDMALEAMYAAYRAGATVVLQFLHERWLPLKQLCQSLAREFSASFQVNAYLTPAGESALQTHYDTHDVFVLQAAGSKRWRLYDSPIPLPLQGQPHDAKTRTCGPPMHEFDLEPGDLIYIPRGCMHDAVSRESTSLHMTVGINGISWASVILRSVESVIASDVQFRRSLPFAFAAGERGRANAVAEFDRLLELIRDRIDSRAVIDSAVFDATCAKAPALDDHLLDLDQLRQADLHTPIAVRSDADPVLTITSDLLALEFYGKKVQMPAYTEADVRFIISTPVFTPAELPGDLDDAGKLVLVTSLIREGLLTFIRSA